MASFPSNSIVQLPLRDRVITTHGFLSRPWEIFFRLLQDVISPLGAEYTAELKNDQSQPLDIPGLAVNSKKVSQAMVEYLIQRVTVETNPVELVETGYFYLLYRPTQEKWVKVGSTTAGDTSGVTLTVTDAGQVQYVSTIVDGSPSISKINFRIRTLSGKNKQYSGFG